MAEETGVQRKLVHGVTKSWTQISDWTTITNIYIYTHTIHILNMSIYIYTCIYTHIYIYLVYYVYIYSMCILMHIYAVCYCCSVPNSCLTLCVPTDYNPSGSSVHGILQARILEWVVIPFFRDLPDPEIESRSSALQADSLPLSHQGSPYI